MQPNPSTTGIGPLPGTTFPCHDTANAATPHRSRHHWRTRAWARRSCHRRQIRAAQHAMREQQAEDNDDLAHHHVRTLTHLPHSPQTSPCRCPHRRGHHDAPGQPLERVGDVELRGGCRCKEIDKHGGHARLDTEDGGALVQGGRRTQASTAVIVGQARVSPWQRKGGISSGQQNPSVRWSSIGVDCDSGNA
jgi:hypothetical protein